jgi:hypothetical protein
VRVAAPRRVDGRRLAPGSGRERPFLIHNTLAWPSACAQQ